MKANLLEIYSILLPELKIPSEIRQHWTEKKKKQFSISSAVVFLTLGLGYALHFFFVDIPLDKKPIGLYISYRFGLALLSLFGIYYSLFSGAISRNLYYLEACLIGLPFTVLQAQSMIWRPSTPYAYSIVIPTIITVGLGQNIGVSLTYLFISFSLCIPAWSKLAIEPPYIISAVVVAIIAVVVLRSRSNIEVQAFLSENERQNAEADLARVALQVVHDIKSPAAALRVLLVQEDALNSESKHLLFSGINRILTISADLLDRFRRNSQVAKINEGLTHLVELVNEAALLVNLNFQNRPQIVNRAPPNPSEFTIEFNPTLLFRCISNILTNAFEASHSDGRPIEILYTLNSETIQVAIKDYGTGIDSNTLQNIGVSGATFFKKDGHGLGLSFAKSVITAGGGHLRIESVPERGTCVTLIFPRSKE